MNKSRGETESFKESIFKWTTDFFVTWDWSEWQLWNGIYRTSLLVQMLYEKWHFISWNWLFHLVIWIMIVQMSSDLLLLVNWWYGNESWHLISYLLLITQLLRYWNISLQKYTLPRHYLDDAFDGSSTVASCLDLKRWPAFHPKGRSNDGHLVAVM